MSEEDKEAGRRIGLLLHQQLGQLTRDQVVELQRMGVSDRIKEVGEVLRGSPFFYRAIQREIKVREARDGQFTTLDPIRAMAMRMLAEDYGCNLDGVDIHTAWDPVTHVLTYRAVPSIPALMKANAAAFEKLRGREGKR